MSAGTRIAGYARVAGAVARRPGLWPTAIRQARRTAAPGWWRRRPHLPVPPADYLAFRMLTQYGETSATPTADDVLKYLAWCRDWECAGRR